MALLKRYLLTGDCFLNNQLIEAGKVILWDPEFKNQAMVACDARGRPLERREGEEFEPVQVIDIEPSDETDAPVEHTPEARANLIKLAVQDVLDADDDSHWTAKDEIRIDTIRNMAKIEDVTRDEIQAAYLSIAETDEQKKGTDAAKARAASKAT